MTLSELDAALRAISDELRAIDADTPEMSGMDLAYDRGNVSHDEWQSANDAAKRGVMRQEEQVMRIDRLRAAHPELMSESLERLLDRLARLQRSADAELAGVPEAEQDRTLRFNRSLLSDLAATLTAWRDGTESQRWAPWAWRVVFRVADETEAVLARGRA